MIVETEANESVQFSCAAHSCVLTLLKSLRVWESSPRLKFYMTIPGMQDGASEYRIHRDVHPSLGSLYIFKFIKSEILKKSKEAADMDSFF